VPIVKSPHLGVGSVSKTSKVIETTSAVTTENKEESDPSETDCSINLIPELLEGSSSVPLDTESTKDSTRVKGANSIEAVATAQRKANESIPLTDNDSTKKVDTLPVANSNKKKIAPVGSGDIASSDLLSSDLTSSDSDCDVVPVTKKRSKRKPPKVSTKVTSKKKSSNKQTHGQVIYVCASIGCCCICCFRTLQVHLKLFQLAKQKVGFNLVSQALPFFCVLV